MPLINRIEIANFMNSKRVEPWRPDWAFQQFDLKGENTAINMPNGRGKSTLVLTILGMFSHDKVIHDIRKNHFAPHSKGQFTHVRIETYIWVEESSPVDLVVQSGGDVGGAPMVFGLYGDAGEAGSLNFYAYRGNFEDCPIGRRDGNMVTLIRNSEFSTKLSTMPGCFPATKRDDTRVNWREYVSGIFDMPSIEQQLIYQKANGAEGSSGYLDVSVPRGMQFDESIFYERLAPELLVDMMGNIQEYSDERGIEDLIQKKVQGIVKAKVRTNKTTDDLEKTQRVLRELERIKNKATTTINVKNDLNDKIGEISFNHAVLKEIVVNNPISGLLHQPSEDDPMLIRSLVMQKGNWYLPDRVFEIFTGEKPSHINERAIRHSIDKEFADKSQLIDFTCDSFFSKDSLISKRGPAGSLYGLNAVINLLNVTTNFISPYTKESAIKLVQDSFAWANEYGDTNPARSEYRLLKAQQSDEEILLEKLNVEYENLQEEEKALRNEQQQIGYQQIAFSNMAKSGLFSEEELQSPLATGTKVDELFKLVERELSSHQQKVSENKEVFKEWQNFISQHGENGNPSEQLAILDDACQKAQGALEVNKQALKDAKEERDNSEKQAKYYKTIYESLSEKCKKVDKLRPQVQAYIQRFKNENPEELLSQVINQLKEAEKRDKDISIERALMADDLASFKLFRKQYGSDVNPKEWLDKRAEENRRLLETISGLEDYISDLKERRKDLDKAVIAPGKVAREVLNFIADDAKPLYSIVEEMGLPHNKKEKVLSMFSALLFSPVYEDATKAAEVAKKLASQGIESPVFILNEFIEFINKSDIVYDGLVAKMWLVGVRTRPVDCLIDPTLVAREQDDLDKQIKNTTIILEENQKRLKKLNPEASEAITARKASEAIEHGFPSKDTKLQQEHSALEKHLPQLRERASEEAKESIRSVIEYRKILGDSSQEMLIKEFYEMQKILGIAEEKYQEHIQTCDKFEDERDHLQTLLAEAKVERTDKTPKLNRIKNFIDNDKPMFMKSATTREQDLIQTKEKAEKRKSFQFDLADKFVSSGDQRPQEIVTRLKFITTELSDTLKKKIETVGKSLREINKHLPELTSMISETESFIRELLKKYREIDSAEFDPIPVDLEKITSHPIFETAQEVHRASSADARIHALLALRTPLDDIEASSLKTDLNNLKKDFSLAQSALFSEIDRVKIDTTLALNEQMRIGLENAKEAIDVLLCMIGVTTENYNKSLIANETARQYLDEEWDNIGSWLENFTRRLPHNFEIMRSVFRPERDLLSGEIISAGFEIEAKIADIQDIRAVLTSIVDKVEATEINQDALKNNENLMSHYNKDMRKEIRNEFYKNVILRPVIRVCIPSISQKSLKLEKKMVSSGQGVAMTLLWVVKMADYVTERELQRQTVNNTMRKKIRSMRTQFVFIDGAFSHLSDKKLITDALDGVKKTRGKFQLVITGHDPNYKNDYAYFPSYIVAREIGGNHMYAESETRRLQAPEEINSHIGAMEITSFHKHRN